MAVPVTLNREALEHLLKLPEDTALLQHMYQAQRSLIAKDAAEKSVYWRNPWWDSRRDDFSDFHSTHRPIASASGGAGE